MLNEEESRIGSRLEDKVIRSFTVNPDGTLEMNEKSYDISAINDYILLLRANEKASMERGYEMGKREGYHQGFKEASNHIYGEFYFIGDEAQVAVKVTRKTIDAYERISGVNTAMQIVNYENFLKISE